MYYILLLKAALTVSFFLPKGSSTVDTKTQNNIIVHSGVVSVST